MPDAEVEPEELALILEHLVQLNSLLEAAGLGSSDARRVTVQDSKKVVLRLMRQLEKQQAL